MLCVWVCSPVCVRREAWAERVQAAGTALALREVLGQLEAALRLSQDGLSPGLNPGFLRAPAIVRGAWYDREAAEVGKSCVQAVPLRRHVIW